MASMVKLLSLSLFAVLLASSSASAHPEKLCASETALAEIKKDLGDLKAAASPLPSALIAAVAALVGALIGGGAAVHAANKTAEHGKAVARDDRVCELRVRAYAALFGNFASFPRKPDPLPTSNDLRMLIENMTNWYFGGGGGLVMSRQCQRVFLKARELLTNFYSVILQGPLDQKQFDATYYCCSTLRSALIADIDGLRELGGSPSSTGSSDATDFLGTDFGADVPAKMQSCANKQVVNDGRV